MLFHYFTTALLAAVAAGIETYTSYIIDRTNSLTIQTQDLQPIAADINAENGLEFVHKGGPYQDVVDELHNIGERAQNISAFVIRFPAISDPADRKRIVGVWGTFTKAQMSLLDVLGEKANLFKDKSFPGLKVVAALRLLESSLDDYGDTLSRKAGDQGADLNKHTDVLQELIEKTMASYDSLDLKIDWSSSLEL